MTDNARGTRRAVTETDLELGDSRTLHVYDTGANAGNGRLGIRWVSYDRPGYGGSTPYPGRNVASAAAYVSTVADTLGIDRFAVMGHSGGGSHALACGALLPERVLGVVSVAGLAPFGAEGLDWFAPSSSTAWARCATAPTRTRYTAPAV